MYSTVLVEYTELVCTITFNRVQHKNSINAVFLDEINSILDIAENSPKCQIIVLKGQQGFFCTGMDFTETVKQSSPESLLSSQYMKTIKRLTTIPRVVISLIDGQVTAGGVGIVAASDLAIATPRSQFSLSEALWGLLPACVTPYLIRRIGFQNAYRMTLTTMAACAEKALKMNLIDEMHELPETVIRPFILRLIHLENTTIGNIKNYFRTMWIITEAMETAAITEITRLSELPEIQENIQRFVTHNRFPWDKDE